MLLLADTHVHLYEGYDLGRAFSSAFANLAHLKAACGHAPDTPAVYALFLTERHDCHVFDRLRAPAGARTLSRHAVEVTPEDNVLIVSDTTGHSLYLVAGRQMATRERLEVLALGAATAVADGGDILDTIGQVRACGAVPVLPWAPGKWMGQREGVVRSVLEEYAPGQVLVGDTSLRPRGWPMPGMMKRGRRLGYGLVAGTDPLPFEGQESLIGRYGIAADVDVDPRRPGTSLLVQLVGARGPITLAGRRDSLVSVVTRLLRLRLAK